MPLFFLSDVHLRLDRPERGRRLARFVAGLGPGDQLVVVGDLCDFWHASRELGRGACEGLAGLAAFRARGGSLTLLPGNHDTHLGPYYQNVIGLGYVSDSLDVDHAGVRFHATHGHLVGAQTPWKAWMKGPAFLRAFRAVPGPVARGLNTLLDSANSVGRESTDLKHIGVYRHHADTLRGRIDVCVYGHIHRVHHDTQGSPEVVVIGGWHHRSSFLRVDDDGSRRLVVVEDA